MCESLFWWRYAGSNRWPLECHSSALPAELYPHVARISRFYWISRLFNFLTLLSVAGAHIWLLTNAPYYFQTTVVNSFFILTYFYSQCKRFWQKYFELAGTIRIFDKPLEWFSNKRSEKQQGTDFCWNLKKMEWFFRPDKGFPIKRPRQAANR